MSSADSIRPVVVRRLLQAGAVAACVLLAWGAVRLGDRIQMYEDEAASWWLELEPDQPDTVLTAGLAVSVLVGALGFLAIHRRRRRNELSTANARLRRIGRIERERDVLESTLKAMERTLGTVAHELRTPLAALRATSEYLLTVTARDDDEFNTLVGIIHDETMRMVRLVDNLLEAARLNSGCVNWQWGTVHLGEACDQALNVVRPLVNHRRVVLDFTIEPPDLRMNGDDEAIRRLIINFVSNSVKHTSDGSIRVDVRRAERVGRPWIVIDVRDTGGGISDKVAAKLGQAFVLNSGVIGPDYINGSGLGLSICCGVVEAHGGTIRLRSRQGQGAEFRIEMPADLAAPVAAASGGRIITEQAA